MGTEELLTTEQVAEMLHMKPDTVARKVHRGDIPGVKIGRRWLVRKDTLEEITRSSTPQGT
jgi:excisionase family DNA binding protein